MADLRYTDFERLLLMATYLECESAGKQIVTSGDVIDAFDLKYKDGWVHRAVSDFASRGFIYGKGTMGDDRDQPLGLKAPGMREAERLLDQFEAPKRIPSNQTPLNTAEIVEKIVVPASDRIVQIDHNSAQITAIKSKSSELLNQLSEANDLGDLTPQEAKIAAQEVQFIADSFDQEAVRQNTVLVAAKQALGWIGIKAGEALVGALAVALLALVFAFFGIVIPL